MDPSPPDRPTWSTTRLWIGIVLSVLGSISLLMLLSEGVELDSYGTGRLTGAIAVPCAGLVLIWSSRPK